MSHSTETTKLVRRLQAASTVVSEARAAVERGHLVDLAGLDREVDGICKGLTGIDPKESESLKTALIALASDLDHLTAALSEAHKKLTKDLGELGNRQRAVKAYGQHE